MYGTAFGKTHSKSVVEDLPLLVKGIIIPVFSFMHHAVKTYDGVKLRLHTSEQLHNVGHVVAAKTKIGSRTSKRTPVSFLQQLLFLAKPSR
jgi:hypothetical protein